MRLISFGVLLLAVASWGAEGELFEFFQEEAEVITASRRPQPLSRAPATVYVIDGEEIRSSGAQTLWDALRRVPGMDVINIRSQYGVVSIRGLAKALNNRVLILIDGRSAQDMYVESANLGSMPVLLEEIERIEVVEGPASALYGANAINGVINIITRKPEEIGGGQVSAVVGDPGTQESSFLYGGRGKRADYRLGLGWRAADHFAEERQAVALAKMSGLVDYRLEGDGAIRFSGGITWGESDIGLGGLGKAREEGERWFARTDFTSGGTRARVFWQGTRTDLTEILEIHVPDMNYDSYEASLEQELGIAGDHDLVVGGSARRDQVSSRILSGRQVRWAVYFEDEWRLHPDWTLWTSGRLDRHPTSGLVVSPRLSLMYTPTERQVVRLSVGRSFRSATLLENHVGVEEMATTTSGFPNLKVVIQGNRELDPELMLFFELAHSARFGPLTTTASLFRYRLRDLITLTKPVIAQASSDLLVIEAGFANEGETRGWGGELGGEWTWQKGCSGFLNYSFQRLEGDLDNQVSAGGRPRHKVNAGLRMERGDWRGSLSVHRVGKTVWNENRIPRSADSFVAVDAYTLVNAHLDRRLGRRWELGVDLFNLLEDDHYEILPQENEIVRGQGGDLIGSRRTIKLTYFF